MRAPLARLYLVSAFTLVACGGGGGAPPAAPTPPAPPRAAPIVNATAPAPKAETVTVDSPRATPAGATFTVPAGWTVLVEGNKVALTGPEPDLKLVMVDTSASSADDAVAEAWKAVRTDFKRPLRIAQEHPARNGWDETKQYEYETSPNEKLIVVAIAARHGTTWLVTVGELGVASFDKHGAAVSLLAESVRPPGYTKESFAGKKPHALDAERLKALTDFVEQGRDALGIPGVAISLVQDGKPVFQGGFGVRELGKPAKVDADTLFIIASNTKGMSTLLLAEEIDEKKFTWDTPVTQVYPAFKLGDADTTSKVLMRHLVCACTGLPRQDMEWLFEFAHATPRSTMDLLGTMQPTSKFGETFQYSNLMAAAAGYVGGYAYAPKKELGAAYDEAMQKKVFGPLGMASTTFDFARALRTNHASPHDMDLDGKIRVTSMDTNYAAVPIRPAGGAWSSVRDVQRYVDMELAKGKLPGGKTLVSEASLLVRRAPGVPEGEDSSYGMGLSIARSYGLTKVHHGGALTGYRSDLFFFPELGIGGVILTNSNEGYSLVEAFERRLLEVLFDGKPEAEADMQSSAKRSKADVAKFRERLAVPPAAEAVAQLAKRYVSKELGELTVRSQGPDRVFDFGEWRSKVASRKNDDGTTSMIGIEPGVWLDLVIAEREGKRALLAHDGQHEYVFVEAP
jgi:CubicO group peptidase (beta-lactamase class C family)